MRTVINGQDIFLDADNIPEFSYSLNELTDFTKVKGSSSTTFDIPASNAARAGLGGVAIQERFLGEVPIRIGDGGQVLFEGICVPMEWTDDSIKVVAYGDNATWFDRAKTTKCVDVNLGNTNTINTGVILLRWFQGQGDLESELNDYNFFFPLIDYGSMGAYTATTNITIDKIRWAVSVRALIKKFFNDAGFSVIIKGRLNSLWNRLSMPSSNYTYKARPFTRIVKASVDQSTQWDEFALVPPWGGYGMDTVVLDDGYPYETVPPPDPSVPAGLSSIQSDISGILTVAVKGRYRVNRGLIASLGTSLRFELQQLTGFVFPNVVVLATANVNVPPGAGSVEVEVDQILFTVPIAANTSYTVVVYPTPFSGSIFSPPFRPLVDVLAGTEIRFDIAPPNYTQITTGFNYEVSSAMPPSLSVADVISSLATMLRLVITTNQLTNEVAFQHYDDYLLDPTEGVDWSDRLTHTTLPAKVRPETPERFVFKYAEDDKDERLFNYNDESDWTAEGVYKTEGREDEKLATLKFAATQQGTRFGGAIVPVIKEVDKTTDYVKCKPRILVHGGYTTNANTVMTIFGAERSYYPRFYFAGSGGTDINLGFGNDAGRIGTIERFWRASLIRAQKAYLQGKFRVYDDEFMNFEFARPRLVNDGYGNVWMYVQKIKGKTFGDDSPVECELIPV